MLSGGEKFPWDFLRNTEPLHLFMMLDYTELELWEVTLPAIDVLMGDRRSQEPDSHRSAL